MPSPRFQLLMALWRHCLLALPALYAFGGAFRCVCCPLSLRFTLLVLLQTCLLLIFLCLRQYNVVSYLLYGRDTTAKSASAIKMHIPLIT